MGTLPQALATWVGRPLLGLGKQWYSQARGDDYCRCGRRAKLRFAPCAAAASPAGPCSLVDVSLVAHNLARATALAWSLAVSSRRRSRCAAAPAFHNAICAGHC